MLLYSWGIEPGTFVMTLQLLLTELKAQATLHIESHLILSAVLIGLLAHLATAVTITFLVVTVGVETLSIPPLPRPFSSSLLPNLNRLPFSRQ